ncbi:MAG: hypothetical protein FJZ01_13940, partial [Candidatus Sericytochromatia bacterium]|nr:hypothetical protein [Candidatus Tanganyikabacteria bacterium]
MRRLLPLVLTATLAVAGCGQNPLTGLQADRAAVRQGAGNQSGDRYLVKFRDGVSSRDQAVRLQKAGAVSVREIAPIGVRVVRTRQPGALRGADVEYVEADAVRAIPEARRRDAARQAAKTARSGRSAVASPGSRGAAASP